MQYNQYIFTQGEIINKKEVSPEYIEKYKGILPDLFLGLWEEFGFSGISNGLITLVDPADFDLYAEEWRAVNDILALDDQKLTLVAKSAFGDLMFWVETDEGKSYFSIIDILYNKYQVISTADTAKFFRRSLNDDSFVEIYFSQKLFEECYEKLGALADDECYGFAPLPVLGGDKTIEYVQKVKMTEYLSICAQSQL